MKMWSALFDASIQEDVGPPCSFLRQCAGFGYQEKQSTCCQLVRLFSELEDNGDECSV